MSIIAVTASESHDVCTSYICICIPYFFFVQTMAPGDVPDKHRVMCGYFPFLERLPLVYRIAIQAFW